MTLPSRINKPRNITVWVLQILLAATFFAAAMAKLLSVPMLVAEFEMIGFGQWFRYFTALVEITGAVILLIPGKAVYGAVLLAITMACATVVHLAILHTNPDPAIVLLVIAVIVAWLRRYQFLVSFHF